MQGAALTRRQLEVIELVSHGFTNKEIARKLGVSSRTIEDHRCEAMKRLGARNLAHAVRKMIEAEKSNV